MAFFNSAVGVLQTLVIALGAGLGIWGAINLSISMFGVLTPLIASPAVSKTTVYHRFIASNAFWLLFLPIRPEEDRNNP